jgi:uncharacterized protein (TIGR02996 family)
MLEHLLQGVVDEPRAEARWLVLADWLEEHDDPRRAELLRLHRRLLATCCEPGKHPERAGWHARLVALLAEGVKPCGPQRTVGLSAGVAMTFRFIPPGSFLMGSPEGEEGRDDEEYLHPVTLTEGFWLGIYPVTQAQWKVVMGANPSRFPGDDRPVENVSLADSQAFCRKLGDRFDLPLEAQWEWACRAGTTTAYSTGDGAEAMKQAGWCSYDGDWGPAQETKPVGRHVPNAWGLYDMHGNVWEQCRDAFVDFQTGRIGYGRVVRGGAWYLNLPECRSAFRVGVNPDRPDSGVGFRVCLAAE